MNDAESVVAAGAAWFDKTADRWIWRADLDTLDMSEYTLCMYGQVMGEEDSYHHFSEFGNEGWNQAHGFEAGYGVSSRDLQDAWTDLIKERRKSN